jgi:hypothetical protein
MSDWRALPLVTVPLAVLLLLAPAGRAAGSGTCLDLRERRDGLARRAMAAELTAWLQAQPWLEAILAKSQAGG